MKSNSAGSVFAGWYRKFFKWRINWEIFERMFFHLKGAKNCGYQFRSEVEMNAESDELNAQKLLEALEMEIRQMPKSYGECFRHILHRDLNRRLRMYALAAKPFVRSEKVDPRFVATHA